MWNDKNRNIFNDWQIIEAIIKQRYYIFSDSNFLVEKVFFSLAFLLYNSSFLFGRIIIWKFNVLNICIRMIISSALLSIRQSKISDSICSLRSTWGELCDCLVALAFFAIIPFFGLPHHLLCIECFQVDPNCNKIFEIYIGDKDSILKWKFD